MTPVGRSSASARSSSGVRSVAGASAPSASRAVIGVAMSSSCSLLGADAQEELDDPAERHHRGADQVADRRPGRSRRDSASFSKTSGPVIPPIAVPIA